jgi:hypothetical protein
MWANTRIAFAGLSPLCEEVLRAGLATRPDIELVFPWTKLSLLAADGSSGATEVLFVELDGPELPTALRMLLAAAKPLRIVALTADASKATLFTLQERRTILLGVTPERLWGASTRGH